MMVDRRLRALTILERKAASDAARQAASLRGLAAREFSTFDKITRITELIESAAQSAPGETNRGSIEASLFLAKSLAEQRTALTASLQEISDARETATRELGHAAIQAQMFKAEAESTRLRVAAHQSTLADDIQSEQSRALAKMSTRRS
ncbi:MAG: hypothetical protein AAFR53_02880 [Pseudomonadota bacterium]